MKHAREVATDETPASEAPSRESLPNGRVAQEAPANEFVPHGRAAGECMEPSATALPQMGSQPVQPDAPRSGFVPATARLRMAPSTSRLGTVSGLIDRGRNHAEGYHEGESAFDRLVDDLTENAGASDDYSVRSVFRAISDDARTNKQGAGFQAAREAAAEALGRLKATLPTHHEAGKPHISPPSRQKARTRRRGEGS